MKRSRKIVGYLLVGLAAVCVFVGVSPLFVIRFEAYAAGLILFIAGAVVLIGSDLGDTFRRGFRATRDARRRSAGGGSSPSVAIDPLLPVQILKLARTRQGVLTVADVAMELNVPLDQAQEGMNQCVKAGNALPDYDISRGHPLYRFPEFLPPSEGRIES